MNSVLTRMPQPFDWIKIPAGNGTLQADANITLTIPDQDYWLAKYPTTNAQFAQFIEAGGYENERWWTAAGWQVRLEGWHFNSNYAWEASGIAWTQPRFWDDANYNQPTQPVVGVSWYEALAFCLWLSDVTGEKIMLPTEAQWQYAAQGTDGRTYPWGNTWDTSRANSAESGHKKPTSVIFYEGRGDSPFGVVDMAGNVGEWCLTNYENTTNSLPNKSDFLAVRGGSWGNNPDYLRAACREWRNPHYRNDFIGFRLTNSASDFLKTTPNYNQRAIMP